MKFRNLITLVCAMALLCSCSGKMPVVSTGAEGTLCIGGMTMGQNMVDVTITKAIDPDFHVEILDAQGIAMEGMSWAVGSAVPENIRMSPGSYSLHAFTHEGDWRAPRNGFGTAVFDTNREFEIKPESVTYLDIEVPMANYALGFTTQENFDKWFSNYSLSVTEEIESAGTARSVNIAEESSYAYFDASELKIQFRATNMDGEEFSTTVQTIKKLKPGHMYTIYYSLSPESKGKIDIEITVDDQWDDVSDPDDDVTISEN